MEKTNKVIRYVLINTPSGEAKEVLKDLNKLIPNIDETFTNECLKEHNEEHLNLVKNQQGEVITLTSNTNTLDYKYYDASTKSWLTVDQKELNVVSSEPIQHSNPLEDQIVKLLQDYIKVQYKANSAGFFVYFTENGINIGLSGKNYNLQNFYAGEWNSRWTLKDETLTGEISLNSHYYEEGNVQLKNKQKFTNTCSLDAQEIVRFIKENEKKHEDELRNLFLGMGDLVKGMRRNLPVTGQRFDWSTYLLKIRGNLK